MKRWRCTICGYIHIGDESPERCPNCGSPREKFVEIDDKFEQIHIFHGQKVSYGSDVDVNPFFGDFAGIQPYIYNLPVSHRVPLHKHPKSDELFFILKGRIKFKVGDKELIASVGDIVQGKMDIPHTFENIGDEPAYFLSVKGPKPVDTVMME
ncbi:MAG: cupin domain-containing protein [bacterium]